MTARLILTLGAVAAFLGVALGAFGAHALRSRLTEQLLNTWETAVQYHLVHALGLLAVGLLLLHTGPSSLLRWSAGLMLAGMVLFSGSLYLLCLSGVRWLGAITPLGGTALLIAWVLFAVAAWRLN
jgi:uncharacterized membrane protein YgdD (TMEM256/DUF423 family)